MIDFLTPKPLPLTADLHHLKIQAGKFYDSNCIGSGSNGASKENYRKKRKKLKSKQKDQDVKVIDYADKAMVRLQKKYHRMILRGVSRNIAITAIARELSYFVWGIETGHLD